MAWAQAAQIGVSLLSGLLGSKAAKKAARVKKEAADKASQGVADQYQQTRGDYAPWLQGGQQAQGMYQGFLSGQGDATAALRMTPAYQFMQQEGRQGVERSAAAGGTFQSGGTLAELQRRSMGVADMTMNNYLNRVQQQSQMGMQSAGQLGQFGAQSAYQQGQFGMMGAGAQAQGAIQGAQAWGGAIQDIAGFAGQGNWFGGGGGQSNVKSQLGSSFDKWRT